MFIHPNYLLSQSDHQHIHHHNHQPHHDAISLSASRGLVLVGERPGRKHPHQWALDGGFWRAVESHCASQGQVSVHLCESSLLRLCTLPYTVVECGGKTRRFVLSLLMAVMLSLSIGICIGVFGCNVIIFLCFQYYLGVRTVCERGEQNEGWGWDKGSHSGSILLRVVGGSASVRRGDGAPRHNTHQLSPCHPRPVPLCMAEQI